MNPDAPLRHVGWSLACLQAALKPIARMQRYEVLLHRLETIELALHHIAMGKYARCWELLVQVRGLTHVGVLCGIPCGVHALLDAAAGCRCVKPALVALLDASIGSHVQLVVWANCIVYATGADQAAHRAAQDQA